MASKVSVPTSTVTCGCATGGGEHDQAVALGHISHWSRAALAALGPSSREQEQGCVFELPTDFAPICTELLNQAAIVVVHLSYGPSCYRCRSRRQLPYRPVRIALTGHTGVCNQDVYLPKVFANCFKKVVQS